MRPTVIVLGMTDLMVIRAPMEMAALGLASCIGGLVTHKVSRKLKVM